MVECLSLWAATPLFIGVKENRVSLHSQQTLAADISVVVVGKPLANCLVLVGGGVTLEAEHSIEQRADEHCAQHATVHQASAVLTGSCFVHCLALVGRCMSRRVW